jgi:hypothetical protein
MKVRKYEPPQVYKALVALATAISEALALGLVPAPYDKWAVVTLAVLGAYGVFRVPNAPLEP